MTRRRTPEIRALVQSAKSKLKASIRETKAKIRQSSRKTSSEGEAPSQDNIKTLDAALKAYESLARRECVRGAACLFATSEGKGRRFTPAIAGSGRSTELHCSPECAFDAIAKREGWLRPPRVAVEMEHVPTRPVVAEEAPSTSRLRASAERVAKDLRAKGIDVVVEPARPIRPSLPDDDPGMTAMWGPYRDVVRELRGNAKSRRCLMSCGHEITVLAGRRRMRCAKCKKGHVR